MEADRLRHPLDLRRRQRQRLAEVAHGAARAVGGEGGDEGGAVGAVAGVHARDQDLADVAREVEVDVGHRRRFVVEEAAGEEPVLDRVDVREAGQVADDRADAGAAAAPRRQDGARRLRAAHLAGHLAGELEQVAVQEEEAGEAELADRRQLGLEPARGFAAAAGLGAAVALVEAGAADLGQLAVGAGVLRARVAVAELGCQVEAQALGEPQRLGDRRRVLGEALRHRRRRGEGRGGVAAPPRLARLQRRPQADRDEGVLEAGAAAGVRVDVAGRHAGDAEPLGEAGEPAVARAVAAPVGTLQLDPEAVAAEGVEQAAGQRRRPGRIAARPGPRHRAGAGAAGEADEPLGARLDLLQRHRRLPGSAPGVVARMRVRLAQQPAEVAVADCVLDQQRQMKGTAVEVWVAIRFKPRPRSVVGDGQLGPGDRADAEAPARVGELHRAPDPVVVGEGEGRVAGFGRRGGQLHRRRGPVEEGEGRVGVQLYVRNAHRKGPQARCRYQRAPLSRKTTASLPSIRASSK